MITEKKVIKFKEPFGRMFKAEERLDFFKTSSFGIPVWTYPRENSFFFLNGIYEFGEQVVPYFKANILPVVRRVFSFIFHIYKIFGNEVIVFSNERHLQWDDKYGRYYNPYVELAIKESGLKKVLVFEFPTGFTSKYKKVRYKKYLPLDLIVALKRIFSFLSVFDKLFIKELLEKVKNSGLWKNEQIGVIEGFCKSAIYSINFYGFFLNLIKFVNPKAKLIYGCMGALDKFPGVIEIQHGVITDYHCQYIYPITDSNREYIKNKKLIVFSEKVKGLLLKNGYSTDNISVRPNPKICFYYLRNIDLSKIKELSKINEITLVSDFGWNLQEIMKGLVAEIERNKDKLEKWKFSVVLHPVEENVYENIANDKVSVFKNSTVSLWEMLTRSIGMVAIYTTVIGEATEFGCFNMLIEDTELEDQNDFIDWMCGDYEHKAVIKPENFIKWLLENENRLINHWNEKINIIKNNYEYFLEYEKED